MRSRKLLISGLSLLLAGAMILPAHAAVTGSLAQIIEGAKKEGTVSAKLHSSLTQKSMTRLEKEIRDKFGVDLKIKFAPVMQYGTAVTEAMMEYKAGTPPSWDVLALTNHISILNQAGVVEQVDWKPLLMEGMNPSVVHDIPLMRGGIIYQTSHVGLMYNPEKVKPDEAPRTLSDLANPKWKGKGGIQNGASSWLRWSLALGREKIVTTLRAIMKNGAIQGSYPDLSNRYLIGEISWCVIGSSFLKGTLDKGMPAAWQSLDMSDVTEASVMVVKRATHPNAAKLLCLYLASPDGSKFMVEEAGVGNLYYPGNYERDIRQQDQKQGIKEAFGERNTELLEFYGSKEGAQWQKEIQLILQSGGAN